MKNINLMPTNYYNKHKFKNFVRKIVALEATIFLITILFVILTYYTIHVKTVELESLNQTINDIKFIDSNKVSQLVNKQQAEIELYKEINYFFNNEVGAESSIYIVMLNVLDDMEVLEMSYNRYNKRIVIRIQTEDKNAIPIFINNLNNTNLFNNIYILNSNNNNNGTIFTIEMFINNLH